MTATAIPPPTAWPIRWTKRLGYLLFLVVCAELALQGFYRFNHGAFLFERIALPIFVADPHRGWGVKPGLAYTHVTNEFSARLYTNREGFRVSEKREEFSLDKDPSRYRIVLLGPSFAFGWAADFEDSFAARLEETLESVGLARGRDVEIINAGVPSLPPANNLNWYKRVGREYRPDLVIQLMHGSMLAYNRVRNTHRVDAAGYLLPAQVSRLGRIRQSAKRLGLVFYSWSIYTELRGRLGSTGREAGRPGSVRTADVGTPANRRFDPKHPQVAETIAFFENLRRATEDSGARLLVVSFPPAYGIHREDERRWKNDGVWNVEELVGYNRDFCAYLNQHRSPCVDIHEDLRRVAESSGQRLYYWLDTHWTPLGNRVAAQAVSNHLSSHLL